MKPIHRNAHLDSLKGIAILVTCFAHFASINRTDFNWFLNVSIYVFHMPLFAYTSGSARAMSSSSSAKNIAVAMSQYVMAQVIYTLLWPERFAPFTLLIPSGINWFFCQLFFGKSAWFLCKSSPFHK